MPSKCAHRWLLEPTGMTPAGKCKLCGEVRIFTNEAVKKHEAVPSKIRSQVTNDYNARLMSAKTLMYVARYD